MNRQRQVIRSPGHDDLVECTVQQRSTGLLLLGGNSLEQQDAGDRFLSQMAEDSVIKAGEMNLLEPVVVPKDRKTKILQWAGNYDKKATRTLLDCWIQDNAVLFLCFETCPYCIQVKSILDQKKVQPKIVELDSLGIQKYAIRAEMIAMVDQVSIPAVWIGGEFIGGCNDGGGRGGVKTLEESGELDTLIEKAVS